jgi:hypothetical protein
MCDFLKEVGSDLAAKAAKLSLVELGRQMNVVDGSAEAPFPIRSTKRLAREHTPNRRRTDRSGGSVRADAGFLPIAECCLVQLARN